MWRAPLMISVAVVSGLLTNAPRAKALSVELAWLAHQGGRSLDIYATDPAPEQLFAAGLSMAQAAIAAYETTSAARARESGKAHYDVRRFLSATANTQVLFAEDNRALVIAVRGTQEVADWLVDIAQLVTIGVPVRVHAGFNAAANAALNQVGAEASAAISRGKQVWLTGHSLGGAVAQLLALKLYHQGIEVSGLHTFGSPAAGTSTWAQEYDRVLRRKTHRWVNDRDPIVCYPARQESWQQAGRQHVISSAAVSLDSRMTVCEDAFPTLSVVCEPTTWWGRALSWLTGSAAVCATLPPETGLFDLILNLQSNQASQHYQASYRDLIDAALPAGLAEGILLD